MELGYDSIVRFMDEYFPVYSDYGQDPATAYRMHDYYAPDFVFEGYVGLPEPVVYPNAEAFVEFDISHPSSYERLTPEDIAIDERRKVVWVLIKFEFIERKSGRVLVEEQGVSRYQLTLDENGAIKIKSLLFFPQRLAPGTVSGTDIFLRDREETQSEQAQR
jgi:hypothetical protein